MKKTIAEAKEYQVLCMRYGAVCVQASSAEEAKRIVQEHISTDGVYWDDDWGVVGAKLSDSKSK